MTCMRTFRRVTTHEENSHVQNVAIATAVAVALGIAGAFAAADSKPTDPQIAHIAYTAGVIDIEAGK